MSNPDHRPGLGTMPFGNYCLCIRSQLPPSLEGPACQDRAFCRLEVLAITNSRTAWGPENDVKGIFGCGGFADHLSRECPIL